MVFIGGLLERCLTGNHVEQNYADSENVCLAWLVLHLEMNLRGHVIDRAYEGLGILFKRGSEHKVRNLDRVVVVGINKQILWFKVAVREPTIVDLRKPIDDLLQVVACNFLL